MAAGGGMTQARHSERNTKHSAAAACDIICHQVQPEG